jgi:lipid II:glycine glycyltransferase (peptidoglycan interpeptide bridge formation enzyme)
VPLPDRQANIAIDKESAIVSLTIPNASEWNEQLLRLGGHLLQTEEWGNFKSQYGWSAVRVRYPMAGEARAMAQVLFKRRGPFSIAYLPRGPVFAENDGDAVIALFDEIDRVARKEHALYLIIESNDRFPLVGTFKQYGFVRGGEHIQPDRTVQIPLLEDEPLLAQMHQKTRYSVRLAQRRGVEVTQATDIESGVSDFYRLLKDTSERNEFGIHSKEYYTDFMSAFGERALLLTARHEGNVAASLIAARFGAEAIYMYGASSTEHRAHGAAFLLQFEAMRWARQAGCERYDLWGIPSEDPESTGLEGGRVAGTKGDDWRGLYKFKVGFGGQIVRFPTSLERRYHPFAAALARKLVIRRD